MIRLLIVQYGSQVEPLNHTQNLELDQEVNGSFSLSFTSLNHENNPGYPILIEEAIVSYGGFDFRVKTLEKSDFHKMIVAPSTFYDLIDQRKDDIYGGTRTFNEFASFVLGGTGWTFTTDIRESRLIANFGNANIIALINTLCATYECEYEIRENNVVHFAKQIGGDYDFQYRYKHNIKSISQRVSTVGLKTYIEGYGANGLRTSYTSPLASNPQIGIRKADPIEDEQYSEVESLRAHIKAELNDVPEAYFEMDTVELTSRELGERVWLIYEPMGIEFQTRVMKQTKTIRGNELVTTKVVIGNTTQKLAIDILIDQKIEIDENKKETRSRFEQTNEKIELAVERVGEAEAKIILTADEIRNEVSSEIAKVDGEIEKQNSTISQMSGKIDMKAEVSTVNSLGTRINSVEFNMNAIEGSISSKVSYTDYNGQTIASLINQTASSVKIAAKNIDMTGMVTINSLNSPGLVTISEGNIYGQSYTVGRGTGSTLVMTSTLGSHSIKSSDASGFRIESNGTVSLKSRTGLPITFLGFSRVVGDLSVERYEGETPLLSTSHNDGRVVVNGRLEVSSIMVGGKSGVPALFT